MSAGIKWQYVLWKVNAKLNWSVVVQFFMDFVVKRRRSGRLWVIPNAIKKTQTHDRPFCYVILLTKLLLDLEEVSTLRYDSATCFRCVAYYFSVGSAVLLLLLFFCFVLNCKANNSCSQRRRQRCRFYGYEIQKHTVSMHIRVYRVCCSSCTMQLCILLLQSVWIETSKL